MCRNRWLRLRTLAGLPPVVGLYASILPPTASAIFGISRTPRRRPGGGGLDPMIAVS